MGGTTCVYAHQYETKYAVDQSAHFVKHLISRYVGYNQIELVTRVSKIHDSWVFSCKIPLRFLCGIGIVRNNRSDVFNPYL